MGTSLQDWPDVDLARAAKAGDAEAFGVLYDRHADRVYRHIAYRVGRNHDAEDLLQQTFLKAWQAMTHYSVGEAPILSWLLVIAHNTVISYFRAKKDAFELKDDMPHPDEGAEPEAIVEAQLRAAAVRQAIGRVRPDYQRVIVMRYLEDLEFAEIGRQMDRSVATVRVLLHRALRSLRKHLPDV